jgi:hypothetical protein
VKQGLFEKSEQREREQYESELKRKDWRKKRKETLAKSHQTQEEKEERTEKNGQTARAAEEGINRA